MAQGRASRAEVRSSAKAHLKERAVVRSLYPDLTRTLPGSEEVDIYISAVDLNGDGRMDIVAHLFSLATCGTAGCALVALVAQTQRLMARGSQ